MCGGDAAAAIRERAPDIDLDTAVNGKLQWEAWRSSLAGVGPGLQRLAMGQNGLESAVSTSESAEHA
jgi:hypothetical protein